MLLIIYFQFLSVFSQISSFSFRIRVHFQCLSISNLTFFSSSKIAEQSDFTPLIDTLLNYESDPLIMDEEGRNALDYATHPKAKEMLKNFIDETMRQCKSSDNHSFDDDIESHDKAFEEHLQHRPSDLSSWESSQDEDLDPKGAASNLKHSPGMVDLSKFLTPSDQSGKIIFTNTKMSLK